jgi:maltooligosyltrehalose trehalohydrolase
MNRQSRGYHSLLTETKEAIDYAFSLDGEKETPDPASQFQPDGVNGISRIIDPSTFLWTDGDWKGVAKEDLIIYEIHVGTYTSEGTFESIIPRLSYLRTTLGVTAIELMPVGQFPGSRNWGYDGVFMFASQNTYGGPAGLKKLVNACHNEGLAVILDVIYNHAGPEGSCLSFYGPYFSWKYKTPWGPAFNYDDLGSDAVRSYVIQNVTYWIEEFHMDGLRLDAIHRISDSSPQHLLLQIARQVHALEKSTLRPFHLIAESDLNDPKILKPQSQGGYEIDAQWSDDFHHSVHAYLTGERLHEYIDFGSLDNITKAMSSAFVYDGKYSEFRGRTFGASSEYFPGSYFLSYIQNHDQVGNRLDGKRLSTLLSLSKYRLAVALLLLSQSIPFLFMGEEYADTAPFHYFVSHSNKDLIEKLREEKRMHFEATKKRGFQFADPQAEKTFELSKLDHDLKDEPEHKLILDFYRALIELRKELPAFNNYERDSMRIEVLSEKDALIMERKSVVNEVLAVFVLGEKPAKLSLPISSSGTDSQYRKKWVKVFDSADFSRKVGLEPVRIENDGKKLKFSGESIVIFSRMI